MGDKLFPEGALDAQTHGQPMGGVQHIAVLRFIFISVLQLFPFNQSPDKHHAHLTGAETEMCKCGSQ